MHRLFSDGFHSISLTIATIFVLGLTGRAYGQLDDPLPQTIQQASTNVSLRPVADGLTAPNYLTSPNDGTGRLFVTDQTGKAHVIDDGQLQPEPFLDVSPGGRDAGASNQRAIVDVNTNFDERGLLGLAFHPNFDQPGAAGHRKVYTYTSEPADDPADFSVPMPEGQSVNHQSVVSEWTVDPANPNQVQADSRRELMRIDQPQFNHDGGTLAFGPQDNLFVSLGDGGNADDQGAGHSDAGNAQDPRNVLGSMLRIDPTGLNADNGQYGVPGDNPFTDNAGFVDEVYSYGLRNPFRFSIDRQDNQLIIADVGQNDIEEINQTSIAEAGGANFGWRLKEGSFDFEPGDASTPGSVTDPDGSLPSNLVDPVAQYDHDEGIAVIGGFTYRGDLIPELEGDYIFGDFSDPADGTGRLFVSDLESASSEQLATIRELMPDGASMDLTVLGFGRGADGEIYVLANDGGAPAGSSGRVFQLVPEPGTFSALGLTAGGLLLGYGRRRPRR
jgi:glucose/arabinose dehydrogenase